MMTDATDLRTVATEDRTSGSDDSGQTASSVAAAAPAGAAADPRLEQLAAAIAAVDPRFEQVAQAMQSLKDLKGAEMEPAAGCPVSTVVTAPAEGTDVTVPVASGQAVQIAFPVESA